MITLRELIASATSIGGFQTVLDLTRPTMSYEVKIINSDSKEEYNIESVKSDRHIKTVTIEIKGKQK